MRLKRGLRRRTPAPAPAVRRRKRRPFSSLTRQILIVNVVGLGLFAGGALYLNQFRTGLIETRIESLTTQAEIIASAIAFTSARSLDVDRINPALAAQILNRLVLPTQTRARIFRKDGMLIVDSRERILPEPVRSYALEAPRLSQRIADRIEKFYTSLSNRLTAGQRPLYRESEDLRGTEFVEVILALQGQPANTVRENSMREPILSVAVPVQRFKRVLGSLMLTTEAGDINEIVRAERRSILEVFLVALVIAVVMAVVMAGTIVRPIRRLADAAENVRNRKGGRSTIPDFSRRNDEIGDLSAALIDMTAALYDRIDANEHFAADVAHEIKNPLSSISSAVESMPRARDQETRDKLLGILQDDVRRLDRLITDISQASRLDAQLSRAPVEPVELASLLGALIEIFSETRDDMPQIRLEIASGDRFVVLGGEGRIGQVMRNLLENAASFSPQGSAITVKLVRSGRDVIVTIDDEGPGIPPENLETVFERFYTERPHGEAFGRHSGLGLSISRQITEAYGGSLSAENRRDAEGKILGARFSVGFRAL
ncbi:MAG: sensor histidine kinase [Alphaproteobacteria bacterium]|nr:sensor histidine kinase [Alphaproteobacteria bacterium]